MIMNSKVMNKEIINKSIEIIKNEGLIYFSLKAYQNLLNTYS